MANLGNYKSAQSVVLVINSDKGSCLRRCHDNYGYVKRAAPSRVEVLADLVEGFLHLLHLLQLPATDNFIF